MQDPNEKFFEVDQFDNPIGPITRDDANSDSSKYHRAVNLLVNFGEKYLITRRPKNKDTFPNCLDLSVTGHVNYPEEYIVSLIREADEEINLSLDKNKIKKLGRILVKMKNENEYQMNYLTEINSDQARVIRAIEASEIIWMTKNEIETSIKTDPEIWTDWAIQALKEVYLR